MNREIPAPLAEIVLNLSKLPGLGPKSAMRVAMALLKWSEAQTKELGISIATLHDKIKLCSRCGALTDTDPCPICADPTRDDSLLCLVNESDSMLTLEEGGFFLGRYLVLGGFLPPSDLDTETPDLDRLLNRLAEGRVQEIIFALGSTLEAENSAAFIRDVVEKRYPQVRITRLAQGIPLGAEIKFMDRETLRQSLQYRQQLEPSAHNN